MKKFLYFHPEYLSRFKCDGAKCNARCCKAWRIDIDAATYKKYSRIKPKSKAKEIISHFKFDPKQNMYVVDLKQNFEVTELADGRKMYSVNLDDNLFCPFLTEKNLCQLQLEHGEEFLSTTCATYPRRTFSFGKFFERSLTLTCPVAAEMILFEQEPMKFEFVEVPDTIHSKHGRIKITKISVSESDADLIRETQVTMISILQERRLTLDQRLIVLGLFLDRLQELISDTEDKELEMSLIEAYRSEDFLLTEMPPLFQNFSFDAKQFVTFMIKFIGHSMESLRTKEGEKFLSAFEKVLGIKPDENGLVSLSVLAANFEKLTDARKKFSEKYSTFLENYLVNELFYSLYPWRFREHSITKNFAVFLISYKIFELVTFAATESGLGSKEDLLALVDWFMTRTDHNPKLYEKFFDLLAGVDDTYLLMATLL